MTQNRGFDEAAAHRFFSADCFNRAWDLIEKGDRTPADDEEMVRLSQASLWHWTQRADCTSTNLAVGYWQASRIHALLGHTEEARRYGRFSQEESRHSPPFCQAYAYEALARAELAAGNEPLAATYRGEALRLADGVTDPEDRKLLMDDLETLLRAPATEA